MWLVTVILKRLMYNKVKDSSKKRVMDKFLISIKNNERAVPASDFYLARTTRHRHD
jgi:hypothetical protein